MRGRRGDIGSGQARGDSGDVEKRPERSVTSALRSRKLWKGVRAGEDGICMARSRFQKTPLGKAGRAAYS